MIVDKLHSQVWKRFVRMPYGHIVDYADGNGNTVIPTAGECSDGLPNPLAWGVSIENGAFFGGLYLYGLCEKFEHEADEELKKEIEVIYKGLLLLCDVCRTDGCIARGVADDGVSHPFYSSDDQFGPWMLGLWKLLHSPASDETMRPEIKKRLVRALSGIRSIGWKIPTERKGVTFGSYAGSEWRSVTKLLFAAAVSRELGIIGEEEYEALAGERPSGSPYTRSEIASQGFAPDMIRSTGLIQFWIHTCAQLCARELIGMDPSRAGLFRAGSKANGAVAVRFAGDYEKYLAEPRKKLTCDWRVLLDGAKRPTDPKEIVEEASRQINEFFKEHSPGMRDEKRFLGQSLFAAWISAVSGDKAAEENARACLEDASERVDWSECGCCFAFAAESALCCLPG
ncbi:MAG: hypothetical protein IJV00_10935 [Clostridia bacterium]|nr:hypothetical protein [Clostridia bacterium]